MTGSVAARRYAKALFDLAGKSGAETLEKTGADLAAFASLAGTSVELAALFRDPVFSPEEKRNVVTALAERQKTGPMVRDFLYLLADKHRLELLGKIAGEYRALLDAAQGVLRGELVSAVPLDEKTQGAVRGQLEKKAGRTLLLDFKVDGNLLGGMLLKVGDNVMDASLKTQLSLLKDTIKRGA